ncbi:MAG: hypothetical protein QOK15_54 [Nocardioidaceae bacterium]|nr:hypothetical protein [Nocardioidaceae bacterium]
MPHALLPLRAVLAWPVASQQRSRRNAMVASTRLAEQRRERLDAEAFLAASVRRHHARKHGDRERARA